MKALGTMTATIALLLALAPGQAAATSVRPLDLGLGAPPPQTAFAPSRPALLRPALGNAFNRPSPNRANAAAAARVDTAVRLRDAALQGMIQEPQPDAFGEVAGSGRLQLKFHKRGNAFRDLNKSYREMCNTVSAKIWDEPKGKRVRFDVAGKPGVGVEIPIH
jgi:hypothetical protein